MDEGFKNLWVHRKNELECIPITRVCSYDRKKLDSYLSFVHLAAFLIFSISVNIFIPLTSKTNTPKIIGSKTVSQFHSSFAS